MRLVSSVPLPTASNIQRAMLCNYSTVAEQVEQVETAAMKRGKAIHATIASTLRGWNLPDIGRHAVNADIDALKAYLGDGELRCELAMSYDPVKRETIVLGEDLNRAYRHSDTSHPRARDLLYGTADCVVVRPKALVLDIKTGAYPVEPAKSNWQLMTLAVMIAGAHQIESVTGVIAYLARDGSWTFDAAEYSKDDIGAFAMVLEHKFKEWQQAQEMPDWVLPTPSVDGCRWCKCVCEYGQVT